MLFKEIVDARTHGRTDGRTDDGRQWAITKAHPEHFVLRWAKKEKVRKLDVNNILDQSLLVLFWTNYWCFTDETLRWPPLMHEVKYSEVWMVCSQYIYDSAGPHIIIVLAQLWLITNFCYVLFLKNDTF